MSNEIVNPLNTAENNRKIMEMPNVRVFYQKGGRAKYISHLDITRCMQRALKRAGLPVWYTQGFNPHMYMTFALPLPLGYESLYETMDLRMTQQIDFEEIKERMNQALPNDIRVTKVALQKYKPQNIAKAEYKISISCSDPEEISLKLDRFVSAPEILVMKRTKKGAKQVDIKPEIELTGKTFSETAVIYHAITTAGERNFNPTLLTDLFLQQENLSDIFIQVTRTAVYAEDGNLFE